MKSPPGARRWEIMPILAALRHIARRRGRAA
jgi:hypothetical protein